MMTCFDSEEHARITQDRQELELVGVVGRRGWEGIEVGRQKVGVGAAGAPACEAGGDRGGLLEAGHCIPEGVWIRAVDEDARVAWLEFVWNRLTAARALGHLVDRKQGARGFYCMA